MDITIDQIIGLLVWVNAILIKKKEKKESVGIETPAIPNLNLHVFFTDELCGDNYDKFIYYWIIDIFNPDKLNLIKEVESHLQGHVQKMLHTNELKKKRV